MVPRASAASMTTFRLHITFFVLILAAVALLGRLFSLQVHQYGTFAAFARGQQQVVEAVAPERGAILARTRDGTETKFAINRDWQRVYAIPREIEDVGKTVGVLKEVLGLDEARVTDLTERLGRKDDPYEPVADKLNDEQAARISEAALPGLRLTSFRGRFYPQGMRLAHTIGFVGFAADGITQQGVYGIEAGYEDTLRGTPGMIRGERDAQGTVLEAFSSSGAMALPGADIVLTIDPNIQYQAEKNLREIDSQFGASGGSVIVMEPRTGAIRALANEPTFDPNRYGKIEDLSVFTNSAIAVPYEPGSTFKPMTMAAALDSGAVRPDTTFQNTGSLVINGYTISNTLQQYNGVRPMVDVLRYSLNTGAIFAMEAAGHERFRAAVKAFGFGAPTGIELPEEHVGSIENLETNRPINFATAAFGQGITATALQMARAIGAIANGGVLIQPRLIEEVRYPNGERSTVESKEGKRIIAQATATRLAAMMMRVIEDGTGIKAKIPGYSIAGKTGTAQIPYVGQPGYEEDTIHTFAGFFPAFDPQYVILTKVDRPHGVRYAEATAVPVFRKLAEYLITYAAIPPDQPSTNPSEQ